MMVVGEEKSPARIWLERTEPDSGVRESILGFVEGRTGISNMLTEYGEQVVVPLLTAMALAGVPWRDAPIAVRQIGPAAAGPLDWLEVRARRREQEMEEGFRDAIKDGTGCSDSGAAVQARDAMQQLHKMAAAGQSAIGQGRGGSALSKVDPTREDPWQVLRKIPTSEDLAWLKVWIEQGERQSNSDPRYPQERWFGRQLLETATERHEFLLRERVTTLPLLPLRDTVVFPRTVATLAATDLRSLCLIDEVMSGNRTVALVMQKDADQEGAGPDDVLAVGTIATVQQTMRLPDGSVRLAVRGVERMRILDVVAEEPFMVAKVQRLPEVAENSSEVRAVVRDTIVLFAQLVSLAPHLPDELITAARDADDLRHIVYLVAANLRMVRAERQAMLERDPVKEKLLCVNAFIAKELDLLDSERLQARIDATSMPDQAAQAAHREAARLATRSMTGSERDVTSTYLDWLMSLPWPQSAQVELDIPTARRILDEDLYGLEETKERVMTHLVARQLKPRSAMQDGDETSGTPDRAPVLCFVGPPGVGKTSLAGAIARALGRKLVQVPLRGVASEAEIRGYRRTYIGAMPGTIMQALHRVGCNDPVLVLEGVDQLKQGGWGGDPVWALLEALDPERNSSFQDHYLDVPFDLSGVMFVATANRLALTPPTLRDRLEILALVPYTVDEKLMVAKRHLVPKQLRANGLSPDRFAWSDEALMLVVRRHAGQAGVGNLEQTIGAICRQISTLR